MVKIQVYGKRNFLQRLLHGGFTWNKGKWLITREVKKALKTELEWKKINKEVREVEQHYAKSMRVIKPSNSFQIIEVV